LHVLPKTQVKPPVLVGVRGVNLLEDRMTHNPLIYEKRLIIETDNFGGDYPDETFIFTIPLKAYQAQLICDFVNEALGERASRFYKTVPLDYKLQPGFEP
jgi:hypothetical protein